MLLEHDQSTFIHNRQIEIPAIEVPKVKHS